VGVEAIGEEVGDVLLEESNHGVLLAPYGDHPRPDAFERVLAASMVQETKRLVSAIQEQKPLFSPKPNKRNQIVKNIVGETRIEQSQKIEGKR
jgi:hypothetical protein